METLQQLGAVAVVFALLALVLTLLKRRGLALPVTMRRKGGVLESIERLPLTPAHTLHLVRVGDKELLLATSPAGCQVVETHK